MVDDRTISSNGSGVFDDPNRHLIGCGEHRGRPRAWIAEELFLRRVPARDGEVRRMEQRRVGKDAGGFERRLIAGHGTSPLMLSRDRLPLIAPFPVGSISPRSFTLYPLSARQNFG